ncbi:testis-specific protein TSX isoform X1 [Mus musculus]|uniref:Testis-specific protein TSX n=4 Tax=Mus musculus TaxID=10090 RepID=TSX_MOUSE|nr:testis-specific protein TSX [Mus musculus]NP_033466.1 testis-specific protein TSX [Mus musculus]XP_006528003.1 testis-specific protein TSX isoform X1 [Mus musculus]XP_006528004.1 testis-specific protein TSX isoform X1 [Mus musculus]P70675.1 RecName: Full=Testis-specific protein TSX [Mus musculus]AEH99981.1 testis-specific X-linked protein [Mus musculus domesticus]AAH48493.1 Testis specific X-linked gene [Mus musculus]AEH99982.1 testis-specific X-linked protein [Mus musculus domesticus]AE|eukprot:NP_033466.1 testis-specific protein TSX [Mus musculus]
MSEKQSPKTSEAECSAMDLPEFEDEENWLFKVLGFQPGPSSALDDDTDDQADEPLSAAEFLHLQDILQEDRVSSTDDEDTCQAGCTEDDETSHSDRDIDNNVKVITGNIKASPSMYMEMFTDQNPQADQDLEETESDGAMNPTD